MSGDRADSPTPASDFTAADQPSSSEALTVVAATTYGRMVSPEETDRQLERVYGRDRMPGSNARAQSQRGPCTVEGCDRPARSRGWCTKHYQRALRHGDPTYVRPVPEPPTHAEVMDECRVALDLAREAIE